MCDQATALGSGVQEGNEASPIGGGAKRLFDVVLAALGLLLLAPTVLLIALAIKLSDGGPVLYRHRRIGFNGRSFDCLKFRTMVKDSDRVLQNYLNEHSEVRAEWAVSQKLKYDPRVTSLGIVLRKLSIDELPQLLNVLRGEMSIVGPRPIVEEEALRYGPDAIRHYYSVRPGVTGLWQVSGRNDLTYDARVALDTDYVQNWTLSSDVILILRTIPAVLSSRGTY